MAIYSYRLFSALASGVATLILTLAASDTAISMAMLARAAA